MARVLIVDNYDSFTYNLYQSFAKLSKDFDVETCVVRNDEPILDTLETDDIVAIVISPGPGKPQAAGQSLRIIKELHQHKPILGVCLGHQAIGECFEVALEKAPYPMHGKAELISIDSRSILFRGLGTHTTVMRYHSLALMAASFPSELSVTARTNDGVVMAFEHSLYPSFGVQFHPESFLSPDGESIVNNFLCHAIQLFS